ncbi:MAG: energy-coupled thiamine transporter ThiT [Bacillota bacterium]|nr:energy-coupled thiamine transporter ThiT [Bacillota bacterium]
MRNENVKMIVEAGVMIALAYVLSLVKIWQAPMGGSVTAGSMIPIVLFALRWGYKKGVLIGVIYGIIQFMLGPKWSYHPVSILFDYLIAFGVLGFAGIFNGEIKKTVFGVFVAIFLRYICHVISGVVVFASYAPETMSPLVYSLIYNSQYLIPEFIITGLILSVLYKPLKSNKLLKI